MIVNDRWAILTVKLTIDVMLDVAVMPVEHAGPLKEGSGGARHLFHADARHALTTNARDARQPGQLDDGPKKRAAPIAHPSIACAMAGVAFAMAFDLGVDQTKK